jgi:hypothetical protein
MCPPVKPYCFPAGSNWLLRLQLHDKRMVNHYRTSLSSYSFCTANNRIIYLFNQTDAYSTWR